MEVVLIIFVVIIVGWIFRPKIERADNTPPPTPPTISEVVQKRTEQLTADCLYQWIEDGEIMRLIFKPQKSALLWNYGFTFSRVDVDSSNIKKDYNIGAILIQSAWAQMIGVQVPQPTAPIDGYVKLSPRCGYIPVFMNVGEELLTITPHHKEVEDEVLVEDANEEKNENKHNIAPPKNSHPFEGITGDMVMRWENDGEEYRLIFDPVKEIQKYDFYCSRRYYPRPSDFGINDYSDFNAIIHWVCISAHNEGKTYILPTPLAPHLNGVIIYCELLKEEKTLVEAGAHLLTLYVGDKAQELKEKRAALQKAKAEEEEREQIRQKILARQKRRDIEKQVRQELIDNGELFGDQHKRPRIPKEVVDAVYRRDGGRCVYCGSTENLHLDHIIPFSRGGATNIENLQLLCQKCNLQKSNKIG